MPDLSRILEDVYNPPAGEVEVASEAALDKAFADWVPSLSEDATSTERSLFSMAYDEPTVEPARPTLEWLTAEVRTDEIATQPAEGLGDVTDLASFAGEQVVRRAPVTHVDDHDDILPRRRRSDRVASVEAAVPAPEAVTDPSSFAGGSSAGPEAHVGDLSHTDSVLELGRLHEESPVSEPVAEDLPSRWQRDSDNILPGRRSTFRLRRR